MLNIRMTSEFDNDFRQLTRSGKNVGSLWDIIDILANREPIPIEYRDHALKGRFRGIRDIHIEPDWLLLYRVTPTDLVLIRTGTHTDLF